MGNVLSRVGYVILTLGIVFVAGPMASSCQSIQVSVKPEPPQYRTEAFNLAAGQYNTLTLKWLDAGNTLEGYFMAEGGNNDVGFRVQAPNGGYLVNLPKVAGKYNFNFRISEAGPYTMFFDNSFSVVTSKHVTLVYRAY